MRQGLQRDRQPRHRRGKGYMPTYSLKVRCGADTYTKPDGTVGTAGKGALVSEDVAFTMATTQDQTLIDGYVVRRLTPTE